MQVIIDLIIFVVWISTKLRFWSTKFNYCQLYLLYSPIQIIFYLLCFDSLLLETWSTAIFIQLVMQEKLMILISCHSIQVLSSFPTKKIITFLPLTTKAKRYVLTKDYFCDTYIRIWGCDYFATSLVKMDKYSNIIHQLFYTL